MNHPAVPVMIAAIVALGQLANVYLFLRIRVAQLEGEKRVLDEVEEKYVRKEVCPATNCPMRAHA